MPQKIEEAIARACGNSRKPEKSPSRLAAGKAARD
jgi:hypothetical protein